VSPTPAPGYLEGEFTIAPAFGKPGTVLQATSKTKCVDRAGKIAPHAEFIMMGQADLIIENAPFTVDETIKTDSTGGWTAKATIPTTAKPGQLYFVIAACFPAETKPGRGAVPFLVYKAQTFTVTATDKAPVAKPQPGDPDYTG
jgi:hypothetical protein